MGGTSRRRSCPRLYDAGHVPLRNSILYPPVPHPPTRVRCAIYPDPSYTQPSARPLAHRECLECQDSNSTGSKGSSKLEHKFVGMWYQQDVLGGQHVQ
ncbi:hypothetical protein CDAR_184771 [Caerostris darwini]|uniref:Uncharacterized protein n=1 Tax=Caerostris darwini TaxID=1538125 RepID=A0AAV4SQR1_9ARAC|nr:hypothetical protein CDAR_184771 [Caerostris darwini]